MLKTQFTVAEEILFATQLYIFQLEKERTAVCLNLRQPTTHNDLFMLWWYQHIRTQSGPRLSSNYIITFLKMTASIKLDTRSKSLISMCIFFSPSKCFLTSLCKNAVKKSRESCNLEVCASTLESIKVIAESSPKSFKWCKHFVVICSHRLATSAVF